MYQTNKLAESKLIMGNGRTPIALSPGPKAKKSVRGAESKSGKKENSDSNMSLHGQSSLFREEKSFAIIKDYPVEELKIRYPFEDEKERKKNKIELTVIQGIPSKKTNQSARQVSLAVGTAATFSNLTEVKGEDGQERWLLGTNHAFSSLSEGRRGQAAWRALKTISSRHSQQ